MKGSMLLLCIIAADLLGILVGIGVIIQHKTPFDWSVGIGIFLLSTAGARFFYLAYSGDLKKGREKAVLLAAITIAGTFIGAVGVAVCYLTPDPPGLRLGGALLAAGAANLALAWAAGRRAENQVSA